MIKNESKPETRNLGKVLLCREIVPFFKKEDLTLAEILFTMNFMTTYVRFLTIQD